MTKEESMAFNILSDISKSLKTISESLRVLSESKKKETEQFVTESKERMANRRREKNRIILESKKDKQTDNGKNEFIKEVMKSQIVNKN